jgi:hypothetical protein
LLLSGIYRHSYDHTACLVAKHFRKQRSSRCRPALIDHRANTPPGRPGFDPPNRTIPRFLPVVGATWHTASGLATTTRGQFRGRRRNPFEMPRPESAP